MKKNNQILAWDYIGYPDESKQIDWNQPLLTVINLFDKEIRDGVLISGANEIRIHPNLIGLFKTLKFISINCETDKMILAGRFNIILDDKLNKDQVVIIYNNTDNKKLPYGEYMVPLISEPLQHSGFIEVDYKTLNRVEHSEEIDTYLAKCFRSFTIDNLPK